MIEDLYNYPKEPFVKELTMRKIIEITPEIEKHLLSIMDQALKYGGIQSQPTVNAIMAAVVNEEKPVAPEVK